MLRMKTKFRGTDCFFNLATQCKSVIASKISHLKTEYLLSGGALTCILVAIETDTHLGLSHLDVLSDFNYFLPTQVIRIRIFYNSEHDASFDLAEKFQRYVKSLPKDNIEVDIIPLSRNTIGSVVYLDSDFNLSILDKNVEKTPREIMIINSYAASLLKPLYVFNFSLWRENLAPSLSDNEPAHKNLIQMCFWLIANKGQDLSQTANTKVTLFDGDQKIELVITKKIIESVKEYLRYHKKEHGAACKRYKIDFFRPKRSFETYELSELAHIDSRSIDLALLDLYRYDASFSAKNNIFR